MEVCRFQKCQRMPLANKSTACKIICRFKNTATFQKKPAASKKFSGLRVPFINLDLIVSLPDRFLLGQNWGELASEVGCEPRQYARAHIKRGGFKNELSPRG